MVCFCYIERVSRSDNSSSSISDGLDVLIRSDCDCVLASLHFLHTFLSRNNIAVPPTPLVLTISVIHSLAMMQSVSPCYAVLLYWAFKCGNTMC